LHYPAIWDIADCTTITGTHTMKKKRRQSGLVRITGPDQVNALIAGRNEWRGNKLLDELAHDFAAAGNPEAASAIREWQRMVAGVKIASQITSLCK
jgi:hypothetical protein